MKTKLLTLLVLTVAALCFCTGTANAENLYNIASFNNDGTTDAVKQWVAGKTTITVASGLTGTDDAGLFTLQTVSPTANVSGAGVAPRFENGHSITAADGSLFTDPTAGLGYFEFGVAGGAGNLNLTDLTFDATRATGTAGVRGYNIDVSINGGSYADLGAANVPTNFGTFTTVVLDMSGAQFQGISSVDFRVFSTGGGMEWTDFQVNGEIVPEPTGILLAVSGLFGVVVSTGRRRWRRV